MAGWIESCALPPPSRCKSPHYFTHRSFLFLLHFASSPHSRRRLAAPGLIHPLGHLTHYKPIHPSASISLLPHTPHPTTTCSFQLLLLFISTCSPSTSSSTSSLCHSSFKVGNRLDHHSSIIPQHRSNGNQLLALSSFPLTLPSSLSCSLLLFNTPTTTTHNASPPPSIDVLAPLAFTFPFPFPPLPFSPILSLFIPSIPFPPHHPSPWDLGLGSGPPFRPTSPIPNHPNLGSSAAWSISPAPLPTHTTRPQLQIGLTTSPRFLRHRYILPTIYRFTTTTTATLSSIPPSATSISTLDSCDVVARHALFESVTRNTRLELPQSQPRESPSSTTVPGMCLSLPA